jgi:hypothetical protein
MAEHLDGYVADFIDQFEIMYPTLKFGSELKEGSYRYSFPLENLAVLERFLHYKNMRLVNAGHLWTGQDIHVINTTYDIGLAVIVSYNEVEEIFSFMSQAYFFMKRGRFFSFKTYDEAFRHSKKVKTQDLIHELN